MSASSPKPAPSPIVEIYVLFTKICAHEHEGCSRAKAVLKRTPFSTACVLLIDLNFGVARPPARYCSIHRTYVYLLVRNKLECNLN